MQTDQKIIAHASYIGQRLLLKDFQQAQLLSTNPAVIKYGQDGKVVLLRYGVVVSFGLDTLEQARLLGELSGYIVSPHEKVIDDTLEIETGAEEESVRHGIVHIKELSLEHIQVIADIMAKTVVLEFYEESVAGVFDQIEPLSQHLQVSGRTGAKDRALLSRIGTILSIQSKMVGRVEVSEKPDVLWEHPELEKLYQLIDDEFEIRERHVALERKLLLITKATETLLDLLQHKRSLRVEWYIVILIVIDIVISLAEKYVF